MLRLFCGWMTGILAVVLLSATLAGCGGSSSSNTPAPVTVCNAGSASGTGCCGGTASACAFEPSGPPAVVEAFNASTPVDPAIVAADNTFGLSLFNTLLQQGASSSGNAAIAPVSVSLALQITYNGAAGTTQQAMSQTLQLGGLTVPGGPDDSPVVYPG